ncbi:MAG: ATP-binding protein [Syntrophales bacterium]|nr:ATP-binding protein [Syntrophales bacterium]
MQSFPPEEAWLAIVPSLMGTFVCLGLVIASFFWGRRRSVDYLFAAICFMGALINADLSLINIIEDESTALIIDRLTYYIFVFGPAVYIHFIHVWLKIERRRWVVFGAYVFGVAFSFSIFSDQFIAGFHYYTFGRIAKGGILYQLFTLYCAITVIYILFQLYISMEQKNNEERNRIKYILSGLGLASLLLALNIIPTYGYDVYPLGSLSFIPAIILAIGVLKYDLLDMGTVLRKSITYTILTVALAFVYITIATIVNASMATISPLKESLLPPLLSALIMVAVFNPTKNFVQKTIAHVFFRRQVDYEVVLEEVSAKLASLVNLEELCRFITSWLMETLNVSQAILFLRQEECFEPMGAQAGMVRVNLSHPLFSTALVKGQPLHAYRVERLPVSEIEKKALRDFFTPLSVSLVVPVIHHAHLTAFFVLGEKRSGEVFLREEVRLLMTLAHQMGIAIENAKAFAEIKAWSETLEKKVEERTRELAQALKEKELAQKQMIRSEALAAIGELVAGTAHELNNPLSSAMSLLQSSVEEIREKGPDVGIREMVDDLEFARKELKRAADIVKSLLDVSRQTHHYLEDVDLNHVIADALRVLHNMIKKMDVQINTDLAPDLPRFKGNFAQLGQVFINIIKNAIQALPDGKGEIFLSTYREGNCIIATCADTGCGIPDELKEQVFKPFFTTKTVGEGTGLGLYICHELVRRHNGSITIKDRPGGGTIVRLEFPLGRE